MNAVCVFVASDVMGAGCVSFFPLPDDLKARAFPRKAGHQGRDSIVRVGQLDAELTTVQGIMSAALGGGEGTEQAAHRICAPCNARALQCIASAGVFFVENMVLHCD